MADKRKTQNSTKNKSTLETLREFSGSIGKNTVSEFKNIGIGIFDQLTGRSLTKEKLKQGSYQKDKEPTRKLRKEFTVFSYQKYYEREIVRRQIKELSEKIKQEIKLLKKSNKTLISEARELEKISLESLPKEPGIYHVRFLEIILRLLRSLRAKISESRTWLQAFISKKKKRGSLFLARAKKKGTKYSLSQELQTARAVQ